MSIVFASMVHHTGGSINIILVTGNVTVQWVVIDANTDFEEDKLVVHNEMDDEAPHDGGTGNYEWIIVMV